AVASASAESIAQGFNLTAAPLPTVSFQPRTAPHAAMAAEDPPPQVPDSPPLPPRPVRTAAPAASPGEPLPLASAQPVAVVRAEALSNREIVERANAYFTGLGTLVADFTQVGGDGRRMVGTLYLQRPGKIRFEYDPPSTLEVISDGTSVAVRD